MHAKEEEHLYSQGYILWESLDENRTGLNWMVLKEELTSFSALIWFEVFWKESKDFFFLNFTVIFFDYATKVHLWNFQLVKCVATVALITHIYLY